jgi:uncharacterized membrane protein YfcA
VPELDATALLAGLAVVVAAVIKGAIGFGFPTVATPLLALVVDVKTAVAVLIVPNLVMDGAQAARRGRLFAMARRTAVMLVCAAAGTVIGTRLLVRLTPRAAILILGVFVTMFVIANVRRLAIRVSPGLERWLAPVVGLAVGVIGGITNAPGTPLVMWFYVLGLDKDEFVRAVSLSFVALKLVQLVAVAHFGLMTWNRAGGSLVLTGVALVGFAFGLRIQDRLPQAAFNRAVLGMLAVLGMGLVLRGLV